MQEVGVYGWRKRCLYGLLLVLAVVILCNIAATLLLIKAISFNLGGIGELSVFSNGVQLRDYSYVLNSLVTSRLCSRAGQALGFEGSYNISLRARDDDGRPAQTLHFWSHLEDPNVHEVAGSSSQLRVSDLQGRALFTADKDGVTLGADILKVLEGGVRFKGSVQTSMLRSNLGAELMLESATRKLHLRATGGVSLESRAADISASCLTDLQLSSTDGKVTLKAPGIYFPNLESIPLLQAQPTRYLQLEANSPSRAYQMCMCNNGKVFVAAPHAECSVNNDGLQCR